MIKGKKKINEILSYDIEKYYSFLDEDDNSKSNWYAVSFQILGHDEQKINLNDIDIFVALFNNIISTFDESFPWIVNHYYKNLKWFPNETNDLPALQTLFKKNNIENTFKGPLIFTKPDLFKVAKDLILYSYILSSQDLDILNTEIPLIIKTTQHLTIDLFSTDKMILRDIINKNALKSLIVKEYRNSILWK